MNPMGRISLLFGALVLLVFGIVCLKQQLSPGSSPPVFVTPNSAELAGDRRQSSGHQPTILSAEPSSDLDLNVSPQLRELSPVPLDGTQPELLDVPVNTTLPEIPSESSPAGRNSQTTGPFAQDASRAVSSAVLLAPAEIDASSAVRPRNAALPTTVVTLPEDSLWKISERVYGRGDYYKALFLHNRTLLPRPDRIAAGIEIATPSIEELRQLHPHACPLTADASGPADGG